MLLTVRSVHGRPAGETADRDYPECAGCGGVGLLRRRIRGAHKSVPAGRGGHRRTGHGTEHSRRLSRYSSDFGTCFTACRISLEDVQQESRVFVFC